MRGSDGTAIPAPLDPIAEARAYIGIETEWRTAADRVERGAIRRFAQASMDEDPVFFAESDGNARYGGPVAPHLFPMFMFVRPFGSADPLSERALDPDFDGTGALSTQGLPDITPLAGLSVLNGGSEVEFFSFATLGEEVKVRSKYADIYRKETSKGPLIFVILESEYCTLEGRPIANVRRTQIRRERPNR